MRRDLTEHEEVYVVSDIHMGGASNFQIFNQGSRLAGLIDYLAKRKPKDKIALVLNGDIIDSLAEVNTSYLAFETAEAMMDRISNDPSFKMVWESLARFVARPRRSLVFVLGNHDVEIALPSVKFWIRSRLAQGIEPSLGRIFFATQGEGYTCRVGGARVLCTHGNEVDDWNVVDQKAIADLSSALNAARNFSPSDWEPNAGTRFVVDVMNSIKRDYPFVDLLKPSNKTVAPILLVLEPSRVKDMIKAFPRIAGDYFWDALERRGVLSIETLEATSDPAVSETVLQEFLGSNLKSALQTESTVTVSTEDFQKSIEEKIASGEDLMEGLTARSGVQTLGVFGYIIDRIKRKPKAEALRLALLDWLEDDDSFDLDKRDATFKEVLEGVGPSVDFIVTGHTHLRRAIPLDGNRCYYNCGTWIRCIFLTTALLNSEEEFAKIFNVLKSGDLLDLDLATYKSTKGGQEHLVKNLPTVVKIAKEKNGVVGELMDVGQAAAGSVNLTSVPKSRVRWR